jgi:hypothetical protein
MIMMFNYNINNNNNDIIGKLGLSEKRTWNMLKKKLSKL